MGLGSEPCGSGRCGFRTDEPVALPQPPEATALLYDVSARQILVDPDGFSRGMHPVDQEVRFCLGTRLGKLAGSEDVGLDIDRIAAASTATLLAVTSDAVKQALRRPLARGDIELRRVLAERQPNGRVAIDVSYFNVRTGKVTMGIGIGIGTGLALVSGRDLSGQNPVPSLDSLSVDHATIASGAQVTVVTGSGFIASSQPQINGVDAATFSVDSATQITLTIPSGTVNSAGAKSITVVNPTPGGGTSNALSFLVRYPAPTESSISPTFAYHGAGDTALTVVGTNFYAGTTVQADGTDISSSTTDATHISATVPSAVVNAVGTKSITVTNPTTGGGGGTSAAQTFQVRPNSTSISPTSATQYDAATALSDNGSGFVNGDTIYIDAASMTTTFSSSTLLTTTIPAGDTASSPLATAGSKSVTVQGANGTSQARTLTVSAWTPETVGDGLRITGANLTNSGGVVTSAADQSGNGRDFTFASGERPAYVASSAALNNQPCMDLDGSTSKGTNATDLNSIVSSSTTRFTLWCVIRPDVVDAGSGVNLWQSRTIFGDVGRNFVVFVKTVSSVPKLGIYFFTSGNQSLTDTIAAGTAYFAIFRYDGTTLKLKIGDATEVTTAVSTNLTSSANSLVIGKGSGGAADCFDGLIAEIGVDGTAWSDANRDRLRRRAKAVWGV